MLTASTGSTTLQTPVDGPKPRVPYCSYGAFYAVIRDLHDRGIPPYFDRGALGAKSAESLVYVGLRTLGLVNGNVPTSQFRTLVDSVGGSQWQQELGALIRAHYAPIMQTDLEGCTYEEFQQRFSDLFSGLSEMQRRSRNFFAQAAIDAGIPINPMLATARGRPKSRRRSMRDSRSSEAAELPVTRDLEEAAEQPELQPDAGVLSLTCVSPKANDVKLTTPRIGFPTGRLHIQRKSVEAVTAKPSESVTLFNLLWAIFDPLRMSDAEQQAVFTLLRYVKITEVDPQHDPRTQSKAVGRDLSTSRETTAAPESR